MTSRKMMAKQNFSRRFFMADKPMLSLDFWLRASGKDALNPFSDFPITFMGLA
jgi:hypothetical protein